MAKCLKGLDVHTKGLSTKATHSKITAFLKPSPISWIDPISGTIQPTAMKYSLTSTENEHHGRKNCLGSCASEGGGVALSVRVEKGNEKKERSEKITTWSSKPAYFWFPPPPHVKFTHFLAHFSAAVEKYISVVSSQPYTNLIFLDILTRFP